MDEAEFRKRLLSFGITSSQIDHLLHLAYVQTRRVEQSYEEVLSRAYEEARALGFDGVLQELRK